jgi:hypothetical protein
VVEAEYSNHRGIGISNEGGGHPGSSPPPKFLVQIQDPLPEQTLTKLILGTTSKVPYLPVVQNKVRIAGPHLIQPQEVVRDRNLIPEHCPRSVGRKPRPKIDQPRISL